MNMHRPFVAGAGATAILAATLRLATIFPGGLNAPPVAEPAYFVIDLFWLISLIGMVLYLAAFRTRLSLAGFVVALVGLMIIRTGARLTGAASYALGAGLLALGLALASVACLRRPGGLRIAGLAWIGALALGLVAAVVALPLLQALAAVLFCVGFAAAGWVMLRAAEAG